MKRDLTGMIIDTCNNLHEINFKLDVLSSTADAVHRAMSDECHTNSAYIDALWGVCEMACAAGDELKKLEDSLENQYEAFKKEEVHKNENHRA